MLKLGLVKEYKWLLLISESFISNSEDIRDAAISKSQFYCRAAPSQNMDIWEEFRDSLQNNLSICPEAYSESHL